jgi:predicted ATP-dependent serine protease
MITRQLTRRFHCTRCGAERRGAKRAGRCGECYERALPATEQNSVPALPVEADKLACMVCREVVTVGREFRARSMRMRMPWTVCQSCEAKAETCG